MRRRTSPGWSWTAARIAALGLVVGLSAGCSRVATETTVRADGGFDRRVVVRSNVPELGAPAGRRPRLEDWFVFPAAGDGWSVNRERVRDEDIATLSRTFAPGVAPFTDVRLVENGQTRFTNELRVTRRPDGLVEFVETLRWTPAESEKPDLAPMAAKLAPLLPERLRDPAAAQRLTDRTVRDFWRVIFGPGDPLLGQLLTHPDAAERMVRKRAADALNLALEREFGGRMTDAERANFVRRAFGPGGLQTQDVVDSQRQAAPAAEGRGSVGPVAMLTAVRIPGTVVSTNGERDLATGEVYWAYYPPAAALGDVELRVVFRPHAP